MASSSSAATSITSPNDTTLPADAQDTISSIAWSPTALHLAVASWDGKVRVYDVAANGSRAQRIDEHKIGSGAPLLSCDWVKDGAALVAAGADQAVHLIDTTTAQPTILGTHAQTIKAVRRIALPSNSGSSSSASAAAASLIATGSWDRTVKFWDIRAAAAGRPVATLVCAERVYAMDAAGPTLVIGTADVIHVVDLRSPTVFARTVEQPLKYQTRAVGVAPGGRCWATAGVEGRVAINAVEEAQERVVNFKFRCHRTTTNGISNVYSVNDVRFHPTNPTTFVTAGGDGSVMFWDRVAHSRLKNYVVASPAEVAKGAAVTATGFSASGGLFAYAVGYDWCKGWSANTPNVARRLMVHRITGEDTRGWKK